MSTPQPSSADRSPQGSASEMSNEQLAKTAQNVGRLYLGEEGVDAMDEIARRLRLTSDRPKGGGEDSLPTKFVLVLEKKDERLWVVTTPGWKTAASDETASGAAAKGVSCINLLVKFATDCGRIEDAKSAPSAPPGAAAMQIDKLAYEIIRTIFPLWEHASEGPAMTAQRVEKILPVLTRHLHAQSTLPAQRVKALEEALRGSHKATDMLLAKVIQQNPDYRPSQDKWLWPLIEQTNTALTAAPYVGGAK